MWHVNRRGYEANGNGARNLLFAVISVVLTIACPIILCAEIFKYIDKDGAVHYTNTPTYAHSTVVSLPPLTEATFQKYFPKYMASRGLRPGFFPSVKFAQSGCL